MTTDKTLEAVADLIYETTGCTGDTARYLAQAAITAARPHLMAWQPIEAAPRDGTEIFGFREDCGPLLVRWTSLGEFLTEAELAEIDEDTTYQEDWFYADFIAGGRLEGEEAPTHWMPLPAPPATAICAAGAK